MHNLTSKMARLEALCKTVLEGRLTPEGNLRRYPRLPKAPDCQIIALSLTACLCGIESENALYAHLANTQSSLLSRIPCRQRYNLRLKALRDATDEVACHLSNLIKDTGKEVIVDSTPLPICRQARAKRVKVCKEDPLCPPTHSYSAIDQRYYFGFKLHLACDTKGVVHNYFITPANKPDISQLEDLTRSISTHSEILADKGYISKAVQLSIFEEQGKTTFTPLRRNQKTPSDWNKARGRKRKRIETLFSQLLDQFSLRKNYAKRCKGLYSRLSYRIAALTCLQYFNFEQGIPLGFLKNSPAFQ